MGHTVFAGEMRGTVHRLLLETRQSELRPGSVLLLKQVRGAPNGDLLSNPLGLAPILQRRWG